MARAHLRWLARNENGRAIRNAAISVYATGTTNPVAMHTAFTGGSAATNPLISNEQGEIDVYLDTPGTVDIVTTDNSDGAYLSSTGQRVRFSDITETNINVFGRPEDIQTVPIDKVAEPSRTTLATNFITHELSAPATQALSGTHVPATSKVQFDVEGSMSVLGPVAGRYVLFVGQPDTPGTTLYNAGGEPIAPAVYDTMGQVNGESPWGMSSRRTKIYDIDPDKTVTWQLLLGIVGGADNTTVGDQPGVGGFNADHTKLWIPNTGSGTVTPIICGRPTYSYDQTVPGLDAAGTAVATGSAPVVAAANATRVVVCNLFDATNHVTILNGVTHAVERQVTLTGGVPVSASMEPNDTHCIVGTAAGRVCRIKLDDGTVTATVQPSGSAADSYSVAVSLDGTYVWAASNQGHVYRLAIPALGTTANVTMTNTPTVARVAPDGILWVLCRPAAPTVSLLKSIDPATNTVVAGYALQYTEANDFSIMPTADQTPNTAVDTAYVVWQGGEYRQIHLGGPFAGLPHTVHGGQLGLGILSSVIINDYGDIYIVEKAQDRVLKLINGRLAIRPEQIFQGEYLTVDVVDVAT